MKRILTAINNPILNEKLKQIEYIEVVGKDNFEEINDCINVVDYFIYGKGLSKILKKRANNDRKEKEKDIESTEEEVIEEYEKQLQRLDRIYISMEENLKSNNQER